MNSRTLLLSSAASGAALAPPSAAAAGAAAPPPRAQPPGPAPRGAAQPVDDTGDEEEIVVTGARPRGSVVGDIPPENTLDARDVRATGATSISELLDALAPQIGSSRGRGGEAPVLLLNGQRISGFRELRDIPTEAIQRVEILPEEVALKYGYRADQKVVNIVLRQRFRSTTAQVGGGLSDRRRLCERQRRRHPVPRPESGRTTLNLHASGNSLLTEAERNIQLDPTQTIGTAQQELAARSLVARNRDVRASATINRTVFGNVSGTLNTELEHSEGCSLIGLNPSLLEPLARNTELQQRPSRRRAQRHDQVAMALDSDRQRRPRREITRSDRDSASFPIDRSRSTTASGDLKAPPTASCSNFLPVMPPPP